MEETEEMEEMEEAEETEEMLIGDESAAKSQMKKKKKN
jgi:hypothetical protein